MIQLQDHPRYQNRLLDFPPKCCFSMNSSQGRWGTGPYLRTGERSYTNQWGQVLGKKERKKQPCYRTNFRVFIGHVIPLIALIQLSSIQ